MKKFIILSFCILNAKANFINKHYSDVRFEQRKNIINKKIESFKKLDKKSQLIAINTFFNSNIKYSSDQLLYNKNNHIATIEETLLTMRGDCDDYVLAKLQALNYLGFKENKIFFNTENGIRHVKIITKFNNTYYLLDSLNKKFRALSSSELKEPNIKIYNASLYLKIVELKS